MPQEFPPVPILIPLSTVPLAGLLWKYKRNNHFWVTDSSLICLFWHLLMAVDISATARQGNNRNPDLLTPPHSYVTRKAVLCSLSLKLITCTSLPLLSLPSNIWLSLGYYSCCSSGWASLPTQCHTFSQPLLSSRYIYTAVNYRNTALLHFYI